VKVVWAPLAIERAVEQAKYIAADKPEAGRRWLSDLFASVAKLSKFPQIGRQLPELARPDLRELDFRGHRVIYRVERRQVSILTVRHGKRLLDPSEVAE
jgi:plasmid stabilization system protein ParE